MAQTGAEEILMGCENFTDLVVGARNNVKILLWYEKVYENEVFINMIMITWEN